MPNRKQARLFRSLSPENAAGPWKRAAAENKKSGQDNLCRLALTETFAYTNYPYARKGVKE